MRTVRFHANGGPEALVVEEVPVPRPGPGELLVEVAAVGVGLPVVRLVRNGGAELPHTPGGDVVGRVAALGDGVSGWEIGGRVVALAFSGAYAGYVAVPAAFAAPVPDGVGDDAAALLVRGGQVALGVLRAAQVQDGESVLVTAAAGGAGHLAVQLARVLGAARVVAAIGPVARAAKAEALRTLGADDVLSYDELGRCAPVDVVIDGAGGAVLPSALEVLAPWGRLVAFSGAVSPPVAVDELRLHARTVIGFAMAHFAGRRPETYARHRAELWELQRAGRLHPLVHRVLPLEQAAEAHRILERRENVGRVLLRP